MAEKLTTYDPAAALVDDEEIAAFMADAFETGDAAYIAHALGIVARATGMTDCPRYRPVPRTALPLVQRSRQPDAQHQDGRDEGPGHLPYFPHSYCRRAGLLLPQ